MAKKHPLRGIIVDPRSGKHAALDALIFVDHEEKTAQYLEAKGTLVPYLDPKGGGFVTVEKERKATTWWQSLTWERTAFWFLLWLFSTRLPELLTRAFN